MKEKLAECAVNFFFMFTHGFNLFFIHISIHLGGFAKVKLGVHKLTGEKVKDLY